MLKLGAIRFRARCPRHPAYDPSHGGESAIRGGCQKCRLLLDVYDAHARFIALARQARNSPEEPRPKRAAIDERQTSLF